MTRTRWLIVLFWAFVGIMIVKSIYDHESRSQAEADAHPQPQHFFFTQTPQQQHAPPPPVAGADVRQTGFEVEDGVPPGNFTCKVTLKNFGLSKAQNVQVHVRPFRGTRSGWDQNRPPQPILSDSDPNSQFGTWVSFPDLAPGESNTQSVVFLINPRLRPGGNPKPEISFDTAKASP